MYIKRVKKGKRAQEREREEANRVGVDDWHSCCHKTGER